MEGMKHISRQVQCDGRKMKGSDLNKGTKLKLEAHYDFVEHPGMKRDDGGWDEVMAIAGVYVRVKGK
jgi:hypothetical protein